MSSPNKLQGAGHQDPAVLVLPTCWPSCWGHTLVCTGTAARAGGVNLVPNWAAFLQALGKYYLGSFPASSAVALPSLAGVPSLHSCPSAEGHLWPPALLEVVHGALVSGSLQTEADTSRPPGSFGTQCNRRMLSDPFCFYNKVRCCDSEHAASPCPRLLYPMSYPIVAPRFCFLDFLQVMWGTGYLRTYLPILVVLARCGLTVVLALCMETQCVPNLLLLLARIYHWSICLPLVRDPYIRDPGRYLSVNCCVCLWDCISK